MSRCPEGHGCIWCGPRVGARHRDARNMKPLDIDEWSEEPEKPEHRRLVIVLTRSQWIRLDEYEQKK